ncbi:MAG: 23S rRNA (pseudouridine(1915)-N(3))-methyltransferase RlmH [Chitinophagaceae bacterium]|uniref:23S rRNA (pseudouridine(1915)-N(3))-methyltransferase RlmH n=1 Tax=unclassified Paraflavitalea TaxID=2798305 RepID=UPI003D34C256|nr:23S rRNA (pseudouridine(1915)-N(3))-methyltransferase RlmH [Chitinophagaceae bacterium]
MKIQFWSIGKAHDSDLKKSIEEFTQRVGRYYPVEWVIIAPPKNAGALQPDELKKREGALILDKLGKDDFLIALDEYGKEVTSEGLAKIIQTRANESTRSLVFLIGGAFGIDKTVLQTAAIKWSLSQLTFPHQLVRLILAEQVYRACTIIKNEKYHHS